MLEHLHCRIGNDICFYVIFYVVLYLLTVA